MSAAEVDLVRVLCRKATAGTGMVLRGEYFSDQALDVDGGNFAYSGAPELIGKSVREIAFPYTLRAECIGLKRRRRAEASLADEPC